MAPPQDGVTPIAVITVSDNEVVQFFSNQQRERGREGEKNSRFELFKPGIYWRDGWIMITASAKYQKMTICFRE